MLLLVTLEAFLFVRGYIKIEREQEEIREKQVKIESLFINSEIMAKAVSIYNLDKNEKIYGENDKKVLPIASLAKIMTVLVALDQYDVTDEIEIPKSAVKEIGDSGLFPYERWRFSSLAKFTLIVSANDGAHALSKNSDVFLDKMNQKAKELGLSNTSFLNTTGLDINEEFSGGYSTAEEINLLAAYALNTYPEIFTVTALPETKYQSRSGFIHEAKNTNTITSKIPNLLFSKTGMTTLAGGNLTIIFKNKTGDRIAITVLGSTQEGRFSDMEKLVQIAYNLDNAISN